MSETVDFESAVEELERIVGELERGRPSLGVALGHYERGVKLLGQCQELLDSAERSVALLTGVDEEGRPITAPFDASATATEGRKA
jgi:exodeoxyribonuclease VII small subunit